MFALGLEVVDALKHIDEGLVSLIRLLDVPSRGLSFEFCLQAHRKIVHEAIRLGENRNNKNG